MANYLAATVGSVVAGPVTFIRTLSELPAALERNARATEELLAEARELRGLREQTAVVLEQLRATGETAADDDRLAAIQGQLESLLERLPAAASAAASAARPERFGLFRRSARPQPDSA